MKGNDNNPWIRTDPPERTRHEYQWRRLRLRWRGLQWRWAITVGRLTVTDACFGRARAAEQQAALLTQMLIVQRPKK